eukprot:TRINITY_DN12556_c0_g1_i2.p1 TRINITY_DN12556_c0_g1~~TRINITY_DN12556_c0_g1_i2.p1  ORF type:complete len:311 (-),score=38.34 TRINITY_DN12556_c0_g1_i2:167-1099(-)
MKGEVEFPVRYNVTFRDKSRNKSLITVSVENIRGTILNEVSIPLSKKTRSYRALNIPIKQITFDQDTQKSTLTAPFRACSHCSLAQAFGQPKRNPVPKTAHEYSTRPYPPLEADKRYSIRCNKTESNIKVFDYTPGKGTFYRQYLSTGYSSTEKGRALSSQKGARSQCTRHKGAERREKSRLGFVKKAPVFWRRSNGELGVIFSKEDSPDAIKKRARKQQIAAKRVEKAKNVIKKQYVLNHPVLKLLESNAKKMAANEIFFSDDGFSSLKKPCEPRLRSSLEPRNDFVFLRLKQRINKGFGRCLSSTFLI